MFELPDVDTIFQIILPHIFTFKIVIVEEKKKLFCVAGENQSKSLFYEGNFVLCY